MNNILQEINKHNVLLEVVDGQLKLFSENRDLPQELIELIRKNKEEITRLLSVTDRPSARQVIEALPPQSDYVLSSSQRRLWILCQFDDANSAYNIPGAYEFKGNVDREALEFAFQVLVDRHESLRTFFRENELGEVRQLIRPVGSVKFEINYRDLRFDLNPEDEARELLTIDFSEPFDLRQGPLLRAGLYRLKDNRWLFSCVMHHIISDGWSMSILIREALVAYHSFRQGIPVSLQPLPIQYKEYAAWQQDQLMTTKLLEHKDYWINQFKGDIPELSLRTEKARPQSRTYNGNAVHRRFDAQLTAALQLAARKQDGTLFMLLLSAVTILLSRNSGQNDIIIGTPVAGREQVELEGQIGLFLNTLALRMKLGQPRSFEDVFQIAKKVTIGAFEHQSYPFDELIEALPLKRISNRSFLFDVWIVLHSAEINSMKEITLEDLLIRRYIGQPEAQSKFDLMFSFAEEKEEMVAIVEYNIDIISKKEAEKICDQLWTILEMVASNPVLELDLLHRHLDSIERKSREEDAAKRRSKNLLNLKKY